MRTDKSSLIAGSVAPTSFDSHEINIFLRYLKTLFANRKQIT